MTTEAVQGRVAECPIPVDRGVRLGIEGDEQRIVRCGFTVTYLDGAWTDWDTGERHLYSEVAEAAMRDHVATHRIEDFVAVLEATS